MSTYAKIKDGEVITFPYAFDELHADNPGKQFTGNIDVMNLFLQSEEPLKGYELVEVYYIVGDPPISMSPQTIYVRPNAPQFIEGKWIYGWVEKVLTREEFREWMRKKL